MTQHRRRDDAGNATPIIAALVVMALLTIGFGVGAVVISSSSDARASSLDDAATDSAAAIVAGVAALDDAARRYRADSTLDTAGMLDAIAEADDALTALAVPVSGTTGARASAIRAAVDSHQTFLTTLADFAATPDLADDAAARVVVVSLDELVASLAGLGSTRLRPDQVQSIQTFVDDVVKRARANEEQSAQAAAEFRRDLEAASAIDADRAAVLSAATAVESIVRELRGSWPPLDEPFTTAELDRTTEQHDDAAAAVHAQLVNIETLDVHPAIRTVHTLVLNDITALRKQIDVARDTLITIACDEPGAATTTTSTSRPPGSTAATTTTRPTTTTTAPCPDLADVVSWSNARSAIDDVLEDLGTDLDGWHSAYEAAVREVFR